MTLSTNNQIKGENKIIKVLDFIIRSGFYLLFFLFPIFFLPFGADALETNKQLFLVVFSVILLILWVLKMMLKSEFSCIRSPINLTVLIFTLIYFFASLFSINKYQSFVGFNFLAANSFITLLSLVFIYFVFINNIRKIKTIRYLTIILVFSIFLSALYGFLQLNGIHILDFWQITKNINFNTVGTYNALEILAGLALILLVSLLANPRVAVWLKAIFIIIGIFLLALILFLNFKNVLIGLLLSFILILAFTLFRKERGIYYWLWFPMLFFGLLILFYFIPTEPFFKNIPSEVLPSFRATVDIAQGTLRESQLLGSGPGTWAVDYTKFRSSVVNMTDFWNVRFNKGWSWFFMLPAEIGILGALAWVVIISVILFFGFKNILRIKSVMSSRGSLLIGLFSGWFYMTIMSFIYHTNITLYSVYWFLLVLLSSLFFAKPASSEADPGEAMIKVKFTQYSPLASILSFGFVILLVLSIISFYLGGKVYFADLLYVQATDNVQKGNMQGGIDLLERAASYNSRYDLYQRILSQAYWANVSPSINQIMASKDLDRAQEAQARIDKAINASKKATELSANDINNWAQRANLYQSLIGFVGGADEWAVKSFEQSITLDPQNPYLYTELARVYDIMALNNFSSDQTKQLEMINKAEKNAKTAIELKNDYSPAHILLVSIYEQQGKSEEAIKNIESSRNVTDNNPGLLFQLGYLYYRQNNVDKAQVEFQKAVNLVDSFANAHYFLGIIYDYRGQRALSIREFEKILQFNPGNSEIIQILGNLRNGKSALEGLLTSSAVGQ